MRLCPSSLGSNTSKSTVFVKIVSVEIFRILCDFKTRTSNYGPNCASRFFRLVHYLERDEDLDSVWVSDYREYLYESRLSLDSCILSFP